MSKELVELYLTVMMKDGNVLYPVHRPFVSEECSDAILDAQPRSGKCYLGTVKLSLPCEVVRTQ